MDDLSSLWQYIWSGDMIGFVEAVFTSTLGSYFYGFIAFFIGLGVYMRTQSVAYVSIIWIMFGGLMLTLLPVAGYRVVSPIIVLSISALIFFIVTRWR